MQAFPGLRRRWAAASPAVRRLIVGIAVLYVAADLLLGYLIVRYLTWPMIQAAAEALRA